MLTSKTARCGYIVDCLCFLFVCTIRLRISPPRIKLAAYKFCRAVHRRPRQEISHFCELCSPEAQTRTSRPACPCCNMMLLNFCDSHAYQARTACGGSACVDIYVMSPKTDVLVFLTYVLGL